MRIIFTVDFDQDAWDSGTDAGRAEWVGDVIDAINGEAYVSSYVAEGAE